MGEKEKKTDLVTGRSNVTCQSTLQPVSEVLFSRRSGLSEPRELFPTGRSSLQVESRIPF